MHFLLLIHFKSVLPKRVAFTLRHPAVHICIHQIGLDKARMMTKQLENTMHYGHSI